ncbi:hypothetical protein ykris0001_5930 [Yersinia kristensenii ATCC 33638]|nr:hypothetical protein ykris0001_5930 [Yersinia kristensenii ATCC 33638]
MSEKASDKLINRTLPGGFNSKKYSQAPQRFSPSGHLQ